MRLRNSVNVERIEEEKLGFEEELRENVVSEGESGSGGRKGSKPVALTTMFRLYVLLVKFLH